MELVLKRFSFTDDGVLGVLICGNYPICMTLEEEWKNNQKNISSIPVGSYLCRRVNTPKHGDTFKVMDVPDRSDILFHSGNTEADTEGCILVGKEFGYIRTRDDDSGIIESQISVIRSKEAFAYFMELMGDRETLALHIRTC
jgi:hypothetical protein